MSKLNCQKKIKFEQNKITKKKSSLVNEKNVGSK